MSHWNDKPPRPLQLPAIPQSIARWLPVLIVIALVIGIGSFWWFLIDSLRLGGDALNGYARDGHYFVSSHGDDTEVAASEWIANRNLGLVAYATFPFAMLAAAILLFRYVFPFFMSGRAMYAQDQARVEHVRRSSDLIATSGSGGRIGEVYSSAGMLSADLYEAGVILRPVFMSKAAIPIDEIRSVHHEDRSLVIDHDGVEVASPIVLFVGEDSPFTQGIARVAADKYLHGRSPDAIPHPVISGSRTSRQPLLIRMTSLVGLVVSFGLIALGVTWAIPTFGLVGVAWTVGATVILATNVVRFLRRGF
jgi:hypothetical protein